jgi:regulatory protein
MSILGVALQKLSRSSYLCAEMRQILEEKEFSAEEITSTLGQLQEMGYLNDREWVESAIRREIRAQHGPGFIRQKLRFKGAPMDLVEECLPVVYPEELQLEIIQALKIKLKSKEKQKLIASIARRGFQLSEILKVCYNDNYMGSEVKYE